MTDRARPIVVLGAGPVGTVIAASLGYAGREIIMVDTAQERLAQLREHGLWIAGKDKPSVRPSRICGAVDDLSSVDPEAVFICTRAWALKPLIPRMAKVLTGDSLVIAFLNGIGIEDELSDFFPVERVVRGIVNYAGSLVPDTGAATLHWFNPPNQLGALGEVAVPRVKRLAETLSDGGLGTVVVPSLEVKKWVFFKGILNSALNALCALTGITMKQAMSYQHTRNLAHVLVREGLSVAAAVGYNYGEHAMERCVRYLEEGGDHVPSMWVDLQRKTLTEIEYINGKIVKFGLMFKNVDVDANIFFTSMVITHEIMSGARRPDQIPEYLKHF